MTALRPRRTSALLSSAALTTLLTTSFTHAQPNEYRIFRGVPGNWLGAGSWVDPARNLSDDPNNTPTTSYDAYVGQGTVTLNGNITVDNLFFYNNLGSPTITGTGSLTVLKTFDWQNATLAGAGSFVLAPTATFESTTAVSRTLARTLDNYGSFALTLGSLTFGTGAVFNNHGTFTGAQAGFSNTAAATFNNAGTFIKTGTGTFEIRNNTTFNNTGLVSVTAGTLDLAAGGAASGTYHVAAGAKLKLSGPSITWSPSARLEGAGDLEFTGSATHNFPQGTFNPTGNVSLVGGTLTINNAFNPASLKYVSATTTFNTEHQTFTATTISGNVTGNADLTFTDTLRFEYGTLSGTGRLLIPETGRLVMDVALSRILSRNAELRGAFDYSLGSLSFANGVTVDNYGAVNLSSPNGLSQTSGGATFNNRAGATFTKTANTSASISSITFNNAGALNVSAGTLAISTVGTNTGTLTVAPGAKLRLDGNTGYTYAPGSTLTGDGTIEFAGNGTHDLPDGTFNPTGTVNFTGAKVIVRNTITPAQLGPVNGAVDFRAPQTFPALTLLSSGNLTGPGPLTVTDTFTWTAGSVNTGAALTIPAGGVLDLSSSVNARYLDRTLNLAGSATLSAGSLYINTGTLNNTGSFLLSGTGTFASAVNTGAFVNSGTFTKTGSATASFGAVDFNNHGTALIESGTLNVDGGGASTGTFAVAPGATLRFNAAHTHAANSRIEGAGNVLFSSGAHTFGPATLAGTYAATGNLTITSPATVAFNAPASATSVSLAGGTLTGSSTFSTPNLTWSSGTMTGAGQTIITAGGSLDFTSTNSRNLARTLTNNGAASLPAGFLFLDQNGSFNNAGTFTTSSTNGFSKQSAVGGQFVNTGVFAKTGPGTFTAQSGTTFSNPGVLDVQEGTLALTAAVPQLTGTTLTAGTWTVRNNATLTLPGKPALTRSDANIYLAGPNSNFPATNTLATNTGSLHLYEGKSLTLPANLTNTGLLDLDRSSLTTTHLTGQGTTLLGPNSTLTASSIRQSTLTLNNATATLRPQSQGGALSVVNTLNITTISTLDLADTALVIDYATTSPLDTIRALITTAAGPDQLWTGATGITSSAARGFATHAQPGPLTALGYSESATYLARTNSAPFLSEQIDPTSLLIRHTLIGDATLDGLVTDADVDILAAHYNNGTTTNLWSTADFTYDGVVNDRDLDLLAAAFTRTPHPAIQLTPAALAKLSALRTTAPIPEPTSALTASAVACLSRALSRGLIAPRRRNRRPT